MTLSGSPWRSGQGPFCWSCLKTSLVKKVIVLKHCDAPIEMQQSRDVWWSDVIKDQSTDCPAEPMDSEDLLYLLYTSGTTAKP